MLCVLGGVEQINQILFEGRKVGPCVLALKDILSFKVMYQEKVLKGIGIKIPPHFNTNFPIVLFDGPPQDYCEKIGVGVVLKLMDNIVSKLRLGCGKGKNTNLKNYWPYGVYYFLLIQNVYLI